MYKINEEKIILDWEERRKPSVAIPWTDWLNSTPIDDMRGWQRDLANFCGIYGNKIEFNIKTFNYISQSNEPKKWEVKISKPSDIVALLWSGKTNPTDIFINENLSDGRVIVKSIGDYLPGYYKDIEAWSF